MAQLAGYSLLAAPQQLCVSSYLIEPYRALIEPE